MAEAQLSLRVRTPEGYCIIDYFLKVEANQLIVHKSGTPEKRYSLESRLHIGRQHKFPREIPIEEDFSELVKAVSRDQGEIWYTNGASPPKWFYKNNSLYGTRVNKTRDLRQREAVELKDGMTLEMGRIGKDSYAVIVLFRKQ